MKSILISVLLLATLHTFAIQWNVGIGLTYTMPSQVSTLVHDGDTVNIAAGLYSADVAHWTANNLLLRGVGGTAHLDAAGQAFGNKGIWVIGGSNTIVEHIEFSGCAISQANGNNGAGIRQEGTSITIRYCSFHDNQNGILTNADAASDILIEHTEFRHNGAGDGYSHNMYIGHVRSFTLQYCYTHLTNVGHNVKTRAANNYILYNRIMDEHSGNSSYDIDVPDGGATYIIGNIVQKSALSQNSTMITYGEESYSNTTKQLYISNNTLVNQYPQPSSTFIRVAVGADSVKLLNNLYVGPGTFFNLAATLGTLTNNLEVTATDLVDTATYNYHLKVGSLAIDASTENQMGNGYDLMPHYEYIDTANVRHRITCGLKIDIGAYEYHTQAVNTISESICIGSSYNGHNAAGNYIDTLVGSQVCDSIINLTLALAPAPTIPTITQQGNTLTGSNAPNYQWYRDSVLLLGDTLSTLEATVDGLYTVVTYNGTCSVTSLGFQVGVSGIANTISDRLVAIYPNPTTGIINISEPTIGNKPITTEVLKTTGQKIMAEIHSSVNGVDIHQLSLATLPSGLYLIRITQGGWSTSKIVQVIR